MNARLPWIAVACIVAALVLAVITGVAGRTMSSGEPYATRTVKVGDVSGLCSVIEVDSVATPQGTKPKPELAARLGLAPGDIIVAISGIAVEDATRTRRAIDDLARVAVTTVFVELARDGKPVTERWDLVGDLRAERSVAPSVARSTTPAPPDPLLDTIVKDDDSHYTLPRATRDALLTNGSLSHGVRVVPSLANGKPDGFKLYAIRPQSVFARLGFENGDTVLTLNGHMLFTGDDVLDQLPALSGAREVVIGLRRRGQVITVTITVT